MDVQYVDNIKSRIQKRGPAISILEKNKSVNFKVLKALSLEIFDEKEYKSDHEWKNIISSNKNTKKQIKAYALSLSEENLNWKACLVEKLSDPYSLVNDNYYDVRFLDDQSGNLRSLHRIFICFEDEDINAYCDRFCDVISEYERCRESVSLNLYVDCMPVDGLKGLDSEQVSRIHNKSLSLECLRANAKLDSNSLLQQYNLCHMRTMNKLLLINLIEQQSKNVNAANPFSMNADVIKTSKNIFPSLKENIHIPNFPLLNFQDNRKALHVITLWNKSENVSILQQVQSENLKIENARFFAPVEKTLRVDEYVVNQKSSITAVTQAIREQWPLAILNSVKQSLQNIKKGWFKLDETNNEVYGFSKLKKMFLLLNGMMEDSLRNFMYRAVDDYVTGIHKFCPDNSCNLSFTESISPRGKGAKNATKLSLFNIELMLLKSPVTENGKVIAFGYSVSAEDILEALMSPVRQMFENIKGITKVERRIMTKLFWPYEPTVRAPLMIEEWATHAHDSLESKLCNALIPLQTYLDSLTEYAELAVLNVDNYAKEIETKYCNEESMNLLEIGAIARKHVVSSESVGGSMSSFVNLGLVLVDCNKAKLAMSTKHKLIATRLFELLELKSKMFTTQLCSEFRMMNDKLTATAQNIEMLTEQREFVASIPVLLGRLSARIAQNDSHYSCLDASRRLVPMDILEFKWEALKWPPKIMAEMVKQEKALKMLELTFKREMEDEQGDFKQEIQNLSSQVSKLKELQGINNTNKHAATVQRLQQALIQANEKGKLFNSREGLFKLDKISEYNEVNDIMKSLEPYVELWDSADKWMNYKEKWTNGLFSDVDAEVVENSVNAIFRNLSKASKSFERLNLPTLQNTASQFKEEVDKFRPTVPLVTSLRNPGMKDRHWVELAEKTGIAIPADRSKLTLAEIVDMGLMAALHTVEKVSEKAGKEFAIENALHKMTKAWDSVQLNVEAYRQTGTCVLKGIDEYMSLLDEHITMTQAIAFSVFKGPFEATIDSWNATLQTVSEVIDEWTQLQRNWLYLQPIFDSPDISKQLPTEGKRFTNVDKYWRTVMSSAVKGVYAIRFCDDAALLDRLRECNKMMELVQKGLADYLETKRAGFSRFYFLSNDELLEILSETKDPLRVQPHLRKCFEGIKSVNFQSDLTILGMSSPEGEYVPFVKPVDPKNKNIEAWMVEVKDAMVDAIRSTMQQALVNYMEVPRTEWMQKWAAQCVLNGSQFHWTREVEEHMKADGNKGVWTYHKQLVRQLEDMVILIRGAISKAARVTVGALAVVDVHARDVQQKMAELGVSTVNDFDWISQMRYYWEGDVAKNIGELVVIMVSSKRMYGNEYLGNTFRLVITPLTDKCYLTLMGALQMILGGAPAGPAGTGKTETTKDLAKALAKQCVVFNCSDGLDYMAMGKFFKGLASSGAWACFDEFNRINIEVLSVIAQQVIQLQGTVQRKESRTVFEGTDIYVNPEFAVYITMNPGYAGRAELPDNLEALFRPVAMMVPDYGLIGEIMLLSYGYMENRKCAQKMVATFRLCSEQLSSQDHYDYGMRAVKTVITAAGNLKRASPDENEESLLMRALQDVNVPKFLAHDLPLFTGILNDLFPGIARPAFDYGPLLEALQESAISKNLQPVEIFQRKNIELYEMICVRHGLMVVGPTGGGKSSNIRVLGTALGNLKAKGIVGERFEKTLIYHLNPKSIRMGQLYGEFDENTREWRDGILCVIIRGCIKDDNSNLKWILFDGPVDAIWIENMNTVLDDNKKLCLTSGEIIQLSEPMTMMFEPEDLAVASPATVSRCGMIYMEPNSLGYDVLLQSWYNTLPKALKTSLTAIIADLVVKFVPEILGTLRRSLIEPLPTVNNCLIQGLLNLIDTFVSEYHDKDDGREKKTADQIAAFVDSFESIFIFCLVWSLCCTVNRSSRDIWNEYIRKEMLKHGCKLLFPNEGSIYDYKFDLEHKAWIVWQKTVEPYVYDASLSFGEMIIPTKDSICYTYLFDILVLHGKHVCMTGPTGTGKTVNIQRHLEGGLPEKYIPITLTFSAQTSANQTQDFIDSKLEKRRKGVFGPSAGKEFVIFIDDVNMPMKEEYGAQPPIEILRQWFDNGGWYDRKALEMRKIIDVVFACACGPPVGGRNPVTARFYRHFNIINYVEMSDESMYLIFSTILNNFLIPFEPSIQEQANGLVSSTISVYNTILDVLRPTPAKSHYVFNLRDVSKVFQGMLMMNRQKVATPADFARMWYHENICVFGDRLISQEDRSWLRKTLEDSMESHTTIKTRELWERGDNICCGDFLTPGLEVNERSYEEIEASEMQTLIEEYLAEYNAESKQPMNLVMFKDAVVHVARLCRVLRQPSGHMLMLGVGGSGRQSLARLATFISGYKIYQIEISKGYGIPEWHDNLKECIMTAGVQNKPIVFLFNDTQIIDETMLEDINGILNSGDVPNLYAPEDFEAITNACKSECAKKRIPATKINIFSQYILRVKANVHVVLCMSPIGSAFRNRLRKFPSLANCCTLDWFMEWPDEALQSVAARFLSSSNLVTDKELEQKIQIFFQYLHQSVEHGTLDFLRIARRRFYVTPTSYLELLSTYQSVLVDKRKEVGTLRDRLSVGVEKLLSTEKAVNELQASLTEMEPQLIQTQEDVENMIVQITKDKATAAETKAIVEVEEASAQAKAAETKAIADDAQRDLDEAIPALAEAVQCLKDLKKSDIDEVKSLGRPPVGVVRTLTACCIMFEIKPEIVNDPDNPGKKIKDYFKAAQKELLANATKLLDNMTNYDKDNIPTSVITQIEPFYNDPTFTPEIIEKASKACKAMCMWARAMYKYHQVALMVEPKKKLLAAAEVSLAETMLVLENAQAQLHAAESKIAELEASFTEANNKKEQLVFDVEQCRARLDRAVKLMSGLGGERVRWLQSCEDLFKSYDNLVGDALISAGSISYLGVFTPEFRLSIVKKWHEKLAELNLPHTNHCNLRLTLADPVAIRSWGLYGLPSDNHSIENGIIMSKGRRYPLCIDPQGQANRFIKNMGKDSSICPNDIDVVKLTDKNFLRTLENAVRFGKWVLIENINETLDASLEPLLLQQKFKQGGTEMIKIGDSTIPWNDTFKLFITTKLSNPHYAPEICVKVSLINFAITFTGLEDQLLGAVVVEEMPEMEEKKNALVVANARMRKELQGLEDKILYMLSNSQGNILDDHKLIETLAVSKVKSAEITIKVQEAELTEKQIDISRNMYRPVAYRGALLYFCVSDLGSVDPMYQYSLQWFRHIFVQACRLATKSEDIEQRIQNLNSFFTAYTYTNICRSLFEKHKLFFSFLLTVRILQGDNLIDPREWLFLVSGKGAGHPAVVDNPAEDWINGRMWSEVLALSSLDKFKDLEKHVASSKDLWRNIYDSVDPHNAILPGQWQSVLNSFQKLCVLRAVRPDKIPDGIINYVVENLGEHFVQPPPFDMMSSYKESNNMTPLVFVLSKGSDPTKAFNEFAIKLKMDRKVRMLSLGQGQGPKAAKMIEEAIQKGYWVYLQNCHLFISWLSELERIFESFTPDGVHKDFRLWLTSMPCPEFPVSLLQSGIKMTNEPPKGLKANLKNAYFKLNNEQLSVTKKPHEYRKLLFSLSFFHAVVQERRLFGPLGWNIPYEFNDTDLDISKGQLQLFLDQYEDTPWKVLNFLTSYINYGGRVTDYIDLRTIDVIMRSFYNPGVLSGDYKFDKEGIFYSLDPDEVNPHASYLTYIDGLPLVASPSVFGMHENAKIASANAETFDLFDLCLSLQAADGGGGGGGANSRDSLIETTALDIDEKIRAVGAFDIEKISQRYPALYEESMNTVLIQECVRYNKLVDYIDRTLPNLLKALKGLEVMSSELESIANSLAINQVPKVWSSVAYPSMKPLSAWVDDLLLRLKFINDWVDLGSPSVYWISGFYFPQAFLTGSLQNFARKHKYPIDTVAFNFKIVNENWHKITTRPADGIYIRGLFLEGARWDNTTHSVNDSLPKQLYTELPVLHLDPRKNRVDPTEGIYRCPVYKILSRRGVLSTTGHSTNFVMWIELPSNRKNYINNENKADQEEWIRAGVAAFTSLTY